MVEVSFCVKEKKEVEKIQIKKINTKNTSNNKCEIEFTNFFPRSLSKLFLSSVNDVTYGWFNELQNEKRIEKRNLKDKNIHLINTIIITIQYVFIFSVSICTLQ